MKQKLDERQMQEAAKIASISSYVMYGVCAAFESNSLFPPCHGILCICYPNKKPGPEAKNQYCCPLFYRDHGSLLLHTETYEFHDRGGNTDNRNKNI